LQGRVIRGWVGLEPDELTRAEAEALGIDVAAGIILTRVFDNGPAATAGLIPGDVILAINGEQVRSRQQALLIVAALEPGDRVDVDGWRNGARFSAVLTAGERPPDDNR
jgi:serine protease DegS